MGRRIPSNNNASIHPAFSFSFLTASVAATILIIAALCGARARSRNRKSSSPLASKSSMQDVTRTEATNTKSPAPSPPSGSPPPFPSPSPSPSLPPTFVLETERITPQVQQQSPPKSPLLTIRTQRRRLSASLSVKLSGILSRKEEQQQPKQMESKPEDSIWTKTIMLGEKCKVPDEEDAIIYDERGNRLSAYPVRTPRSLPVSRSNSFSLPS